VDEVTITARENGPYLISGDVRVFRRERRRICAAARQGNRALALLGAALGFELSQPLLVRSPPAPPPYGGRSASTSFVPLLAPLRRLPSMSRSP
jgi:hypothetical protein